MSKTETKEMEGELLPCPFCSSPAEWINEALADGHYYIRCPNCHIVMKEDRRDKVIGMWNTRSELQKAKDLNGELVNEVKELLFSKSFRELCPYATEVFEALIKKSES